MKSVLIILSLFLSLVGFPASAQLSHTLPVEIVEVMDQSRIALYLDTDEIDAIPEWRPGDGPPPLSLARVIELLQAYIERTPRLKGGQIHEIEFKPIHNLESKNRWYYLAQLHSKASGKRLSYYVAVLADGKIVKAIQESGY